MQRDLDETRRGIGADILGDSEKKKLFDKFKDHGGEVLNEDKMRRQQMFDKDKQKDFLDKDKGRSKSGKRNLHSGINKVSKKKVHVGKRISRFFGKIKLYFRSTLQNVMDSSGTYFSPKFFSLLNNNAQNKLLDLELLITPLISAPPALKQKIQTVLSNMGNFHYELLLRMAKLYNEREFQEILSRYTLNIHAKVTPQSIGEPLRDIFKRFYILRSFNQSCKAALLKALELQADFEKKEKVALKRNIDHAKSDISFLFGDLLPKLHIAVLNILKVNLPMGHKELEDFLEIKDEETLGYLTHRLAKELKDSREQQKHVFDKTKTEIKEDVSPEVKVSSLPDHIKQGMEIMKDIPLSKEKVVNNKESALNLMAEDDKLYITEILFRVMEDEYVFLMTSNQIKYAIQYHEGKKVDIKQQLADLSIEFDNIRALIEEFNKYTLENYEIEKSSHYTMMRKNQLLHSLSINKSKTNRQIREKLGSLFGKIESIYRRVLSDFNSEKQLLQNPEDTIYFDIDLGKKKKLEGKTTLDCIFEVYGFVAAFRYRLLEGDLVGFGSKIEKRFVYDSDESEESESAIEQSEEEDTEDL